MTVKELASAFGIGPTLARRILRVVVSVEAQHLAVIGRAVCPRPNTESRPSCATDSALVADIARAGLDETALYRVTGLQLSVADHPLRANRPVRDGLLAELLACAQTKPAPQRRHLFDLCIIPPGLAGELTWLVVQPVGVARIGDTLALLYTVWQGTEAVHCVPFDRIAGGERRKSKVDRSSANATHEDYAVPIPVGTNPNAVSALRHAFKLESGAVNLPTYARTLAIDTITGAMQVFSCVKPKDA